jgi:hypothetical protein
VLELAGVAEGVRIDVDHFDATDLLVNVFVVLVFELLTAEVLAAAAEKIVAHDVHGSHLPSLGEFLHGVPWGALVLGTLVYEMAVTVGLLFLVVPGVILTVWGVVTGPVIVAEGCPALRAPWRSRELVRGSFWPVLVLAAGAIVVTETVSAAIEVALDSWPHEWALIAAEYFVHVFTTPLLGMGTAVLYYALVAREPARTRNEPAEAGPSS